MRAVVVAVLVMSLPQLARAETVVTASEAPPASYAKVPWRWNGVDAVGYWYSAAQVEKLDARISYLETKAAHECVDAQVDAEQLHWPLWVGVIAGVVIGGGAGFMAARKL